MNPVLPSGEVMHVVTAVFTHLPSIAGVAGLSAM